MHITQTQLIFFGKQDRYNRNPPTDEEKNKKINEGLKRFVGNSKAISKIRTAAFTALGRHNHRMSDLSFAIFGPPSSGKTTLAKLYADIVELPFAEFSAQSIRKLNDIFDKIDEVCESKDIPLKQQQDGSFFLPPVVIFIDEVHSLPKTVVQGLLKAIEHEDRMMQCENGNLVNMEYATWMIATTDEGLLFDAFRTRFSPIYLKYLSQSEIAKIVKIKHPNFSDDICSKIAFYNSRIPRKALEFSRYVEMYQSMRADLMIDEVVDQVAEEEGIDEFGMHELHRKILFALKDGPIAKSRIEHVTGRKKEENERYIMPWLLMEVEDEPALVKVTPKGYALSDAGKKELEKRIKFEDIVKT